MAFFTSDFLNFFADLEANNDREWFNANKKRYISSVKEPFERLVSEMIQRVQVIDPSIILTHKEAIFRIYRDTRFSKDKTPYKVQVSAVIAAGGRKGDMHGGMYIEMNHEHTRLYGGSYMPKKGALYNIREAICSDLSGFDALISAPDFVRHFGTIQGEKNKRIPAEFKESAQQQPLIFNKSFYYYQFFAPETALAQDLPEQLMEAYLAGKVVGDFFANASKGAS